jgi:cytochrome c oxidase subunit 2
MSLGFIEEDVPELCGRHHGFMPIVIKAVEEKEYEEWLANAEKAKTSDVAKINK